MPKWYKLAKQVIKVIARYNARGVPLEDVYFHIDTDARRIHISTEPAEPPFGDSLATIDPAGLLTEADARSLFVQDFVAESLLDSNLPLEYDVDEEEAEKFDVLDEELDDDILRLGGDDDDDDE
ncbi:MAG: hypothetical protein IJM30_03730 [Thermoguttaceae bacterium]|nr:hypothetical protein [Thermoguttaceae bacterium]